MDTLSTEERSKRMSLIRGKDSSAELQLRRLIHKMGYRYRLHAKYLPGKPDLVFSSRHAVIFMHGCFWHRHQNCKLARLPKSKLDFWKPKLEKNKERDLINQQELLKLGWRVLVIWECEIVNHEYLRRIISEFLS